MWLVAWIGCGGSFEDQYADRYCDKAVDCADSTTGVRYASFDECVAQVPVPGEGCAADKNLQIACLDELKALPCNSFRSAVACASLAEGCGATTFDTGHP